MLVPVSRIPRRIGFFRKLREDWCEEVVEDGFGSRESMDRSSPWHRAYQKAENEEADEQQQQERWSRLRCPFFMEVNKLEVEENFPPWPRLLGWKGSVWNAWRKQIFEVQTWRQVRGPAGAVVCKTRDSGIRWPQWHTLLFEGQVAVDMTVICLQDVKKMLQEQARKGYWKKWAAKHECEELKVGVWLEPIQALLRRKTNEA